MRPTVLVAVEPCLASPASDYSSPRWTALLRRFPNQIVAPPYRFIDRIVSHLLSLTSLPSGSEGGEEDFLAEGTELLSLSVGSIACRRSGVVLQRVLDRVLVPRRLRGGWAVEGVAVSLLSIREEACRVVDLLSGLSQQMRAGEGILAECTTDLPCAAFVRVGSLKEAERLCQAASEQCTGGEHSYRLTTVLVDLRWGGGQPSEGRRRVQLWRMYEPIGSSLPFFIPPPLSILPHSVSLSLRCALDIVLRCAHACILSVSLPTTAVAPGHGGDAVCEEGTLVQDVLTVAESWEEIIRVERQGQGWQQSGRENAMAARRLFDAYVYPFDTFFSTLVKPSIPRQSPSKSCQLIWDEVSRVQRRMATLRAPAPRRGRVVEEPLEDEVGGIVGVKEEASAPAFENVLARGAPTPCPRFAAFYNEKEKTMEEEAWAQTDSLATPPPAAATGPKVGWRAPVRAVVVSGRPCSRAAVGRSPAHPSSSASLSVCDVMTTPRTGPPEGLVLSRTHTLQGDSLTSRMSFVVSPPLTVSRGEQEEEEAEGRCGGISDPPVSLGECGEPLEPAETAAYARLFRKIFSDDAVERAPSISLGPSCSRSLGEG